MNVELISSTPNPIETLLRVIGECRNEVVDEKAIEICYRAGHHSVFEFVEFHFRISGISRACSHQLVRHRIASYIQKSQRFVDEAHFERVTPDSIANDPEALHIYESLMHKIKEAYKELIELNIPKEDARYVLPNACTTTIQVKFNLRSLMNFMHVRLCGKAQWELRALAEEMRKLVPEPLRKYLVPTCIYLGKCPETSPCHRSISPLQE